MLVWRGVGFGCVFPTTETRDSWEINGNVASTAAFGWRHLFSLDGICESVEVIFRGG